MGRVVGAALFVAGLAAGAGAARRRERPAAAPPLTDSAELAAVIEERDRLAAEAERVHALESADEQRTALLRSVSHDLRTPLSTIRAVTSDLADGPDYDPETRRELLTLVADEAERLDRLVANLLSMSRIEAGAFAPDRQAVDFDELLRDRARRLRGMFQGVRLAIEVPEDLPLIDGDYTQLEQVVTNLLENAARYAPPRSTVRVSARVRSDGRIEATVADEGIGIAEHERHRIFDAFMRGEGSRSSGIGLAICKAVVEAHGGQIEALRTPGGGATFALTLPVRR